MTVKNFCKLKNFSKKYSGPEKFLFLFSSESRRNEAQTYPGTKRKQVPSPRNLPIYKTNLTNRHEKNSYVWCKGSNSKGYCKLFI